MNLQPRSRGSRVFSLRELDLIIVAYNLLLAYTRQTAVLQTVQHTHAGQRLGLDSDDATS
jgi:hypothetical protein